MDVPADLIARLQQRDPVAYTEFFDRFGRRLLNFGIRMCGDREDAKEVVQDTLLKTFESIHELRNTGAFPGWLYRIATNACLMRRRRSKYMREEIPLDEAMPSGREGAAEAWRRLPDEVLMNGEVRARIQEAVLGLPDTYRSVLVLRDLEGLDTDQVAQALGLSKDVIKMRLHRARAKLRNELESLLVSAAPPGH